MKRWMVGSLVAVAGLAVWTPARAAQFTVPSLATPTLQEAVDDAALSADRLNTIFVADPVVFTHAEVLIDASFGTDRRLTIRPAAGRRRAFIASRNGAQPIFRLQRASYVAFQDLDIVRYSTNNNHLMVLSDAAHVVIERCRVGSVWTSVGSANWSNIALSYPEDVVIRNCVIFSHLYGNFDQGISASLGDDSNSILLYNNVVSDYREYGIEIADPVPGSLVLLRNNVVANHPDAAPEPVAFHSVVDAAVEVVTSHNVAFASVGQLETVDDDLLISGVGSASFQWLSRSLLDDSFVQTAWDIAPAWDANADFFRLLPAGKLHNEVRDRGANVLNAAPHPRDVAVRDDWEGNLRPSGDGPHTDRGVDQVER
jgi:hypothetical protein